MMKNTSTCWKISSGKMREEKRKDGRRRKEKKSLGKIVQHRSRLTVVTRPLAVLSTTAAAVPQAVVRSPCSQLPPLLCLQSSSARRALHYRRYSVSSLWYFEEVERYPNRKKYKGPKFWRYYDEFLEIFGDSHATGNTADTGNSMLLEDIIEPFPTTPASQSTPFQMEPENTQSFTQMLHEDSPLIQSPTSATPTPQHPTMTTNRTTNRSKRNRLSYDEEYYNLLHRIADDVHTMNKGVQFVQCCEILQELVETRQIDSETHVKSFDLLAEGTNLMIFVNIPPSLRVPCLVEMDDIDMFYDDEELECHLIRIVTPFELHDDAHVLKAMGLCGTPSKDTTHKVATANGGNVLGVFQHPSPPPSRSNAAGAPSSTPPIPGNYDLTDKLVLRLANLWFYGTKFKDFIMAKWRTRVRRCSMIKIIANLRAFQGAKDLR
ncbi:hypothetical protein EJ110_NYTH41993 [Nymphaea thermarum]|nr:hypothetical protein EJ110_NYTH41993 [Nymphaea thermarum]